MSRVETAWAFAACCLCGFYAVYWLVRSLREARRVAARRRVRTREIWRPFWGGPLDGCVVPCKPYDRARLVDRRIPPPAPLYLHLPEYPMDPDLSAYAYYELDSRGVMRYRDRSPYESV